MRKVNVAVKLGLDELSLKEQTEFFVDYALVLKGAFGELFEKANTTHQDLLSMANAVKDEADDMIEKAQAGKDIIDAIRDFSDDELITFIHSVVKINFDREKKTTSNDRRFAVTLPITDIDAADYSSEVKIMTAIEVMKLARETNDFFINDIDEALGLITYEKDADVRGDWVEVK